MSNRATSPLPPVMHFDGWLVARGEPMKRLVAELSTPPPPTKSGRAARADGLRRRAACLEALAANLAARALSPLPYAGVAVPMATCSASRYVRPAFNSANLRDSIKAMEQLGMLTVVPGVPHHRRTIIAPAPMFTALLQRHAVSVVDIGVAGGKESIELWASDADGKDLVDYVDTPETISLRAAMDAINGALAGAEVRLGGVRMPAPFLVRKFRATRREAPQVFERHGRLYGGFWQSLPRLQRHLLALGGEPVADLDFSSMFVRLAFIRQGVVPPSGDLYRVPSLEAHRAEVKELMVSLFFRRPGAGATRLPKGMAERLPRGWTMARFKEAVGALHPELVPLFDTDVGFDLMFMESQLLVAVLLELAERGIVALPMHDGIMVKQSARLEAMAVMGETSVRHLGCTLPVVEKSIRLPQA